MAIFHQSVRSLHTFCDTELYYRNGELFTGVIDNGKSRRSYRNGMLHGISIDRYEDGTKKLEWKFELGVEKSFYYWDEKGNIYDLRQISKKNILNFLKIGMVVSATALYRKMYHTDLKEAYKAVKELKYDIQKKSDC